MATSSWNSPLNPIKVSPLGDISGLNHAGDSFDYTGKGGMSLGGVKGGALSMKSPLVIGLIVLLLVVVVYYAYKKNPSMFSMKKAAPAPTSSG
jgi:hypothetical protein